jgi:signal transduction histidine kinase
VTVKRQPYGGTVIIVTDTGIGIPANDLARVFQPFEQSDSYLARGNQGTGLGLPLVRQLVERHGGIVRMSSEPGIGTQGTEQQRAIGRHMAGKIGEQGSLVRNMLDDLEAGH